MSPFDDTTALESLRDLDAGKKRLGTVLATLFFAAVAVMVITIVSLQVLENQCADFARQAKASKNADIIAFITEACK